MYRTNAESEYLEKALAANNIPYKVQGGIGFFGLKEVKSIVALLEWISNPASSYCLVRAAKDLKLGIGETLISNIYDLLTAAPSHAEISRVLPSVRGVKTNLEALLNMCTHQAGKLPACKILNSLNSIFNIRDNLEQQDKIEHASGKHKGRYRAQSFDSLMASITTSNESIDELVDRARLSEVSEKSNNVNSVTLSTGHKAKGLEWPCVFIVNCSEGSMPHSMSQSAEEVEEEMHLFYVAQTRAKNILYMLHTEEKYDYNNGFIKRKPSMFINGLVPKLKEYSANKTGLCYVRPKDNIANSNIMRLNRV